MPRPLHSISLPIAASANNRCNVKAEELKQLAEARLAQSIAEVGGEPSDRHVEMCAAKPAELIAEMVKEDITVQEWLAIIAVIGDLILKFIAARRQPKPV